MKPSEVLDKAIGHIKESGWCRYQLQNNQGQFCVLGAVNRVVYGDAMHYAWDYETQRQLIDSALLVVSRVAKEIHPEHHHSESKVLGYPNAVDYNNNICKSQDEMIATMEKARAQLQERGE